jgi:succinate dehydrogenase / fumarate reductase flavoprotein subunit
MMTNIPGLYAMGECSFAYHGANRLGANSLLSCIFDGLFGGTCVHNYANDSKSEAVPQATYDQAVKQETDRVAWLIGNKGNENPYELWNDMGTTMTAACTVVRYNDRLQKAIDDCQQWKTRYQNVRLSDTGMWTNQNLSFTRALRDMIIMSEAVLKGAIARNESRGAHYKPEFPQRDDANFLKTTIATYDSAANGVQIVYEPVDTSLVTPVARTYGKVEKKTEPAVAAEASPK